jgi:DnaJ-domain-containing protein 1
MLYFAIGIALLGLLLLVAQLIVKADATKLSRWLGWFVAGMGISGAAAILVLLVASDRFFPALALAGGLAPLILRQRARWKQSFGGASRASQQRSQIDTEILRMTLDHETGTITGEVRRGSFTGRRLDDLDQGELLLLWQQCIAEDTQGARLLETYLDRLRPDWRKAAQGGTGASEAMTREQAYSILDLAPGADADQIKEAHRRLMMKLHPDHGGSTFLAAQVNRAKDLLLGN